MNSSSTDPQEAKALARRPVGWVAPGPRPRGADGRPGLVPAADEHLSYLTGDWRIFQLQNGHRWSLDDFVTAWVALDEARRHGGVERFLDLGCGIGSVLMMVAWGLPNARGLGVEAQARSHGLAERSLAWNGADGRCRAKLGDFRDEEGALANEGPFDLITGTPPYIPLGHGIVSDKPQRGPCCFETRGGIEDYAKVAARLLATGGVFVTCAGARGDSERGDNAARDAGLAIVRRVDVVPREGKQTLMWVFVMEPAGTTRTPTPTERFAVRGIDGKLTAEMHRARADMGLPP